MRDRPLPIATFAALILNRLRNEAELQKHLHRDDEQNERDVDRKDTRDDKSECYAVGC